MRTTLQTEILDFLDTVGDKKSPRVHYMYQAIQHSESNTDMCRMLAKAFTSLDEDLTATTKELIHEKAHSTRTTIRIDSN